ncbi:MAG TPA: hypothetical protein VK970_24705, partial [Candidatus Methylacidiphilales bacterium]|nr:hypothetical protein [Candidatus Methylacidiphilales bacterium]
RYGLHRYKTQEGEKSMEGSVAFFTAAFLGTHVPLLLFSTVGRAECLLIGITIGLIIMLVEAISWRGLDNLFIPIGTFYLLRSYWPLSTSELVLRLIVLISLALLSITCRNRTTLSDNALMAASLSAFGLWALGGWPYLISPLLLFILHVFLPGFKPGPRPMLNLYAVSRVITGAYLYLFVALNFGTDTGWLPFHICLACSTGNMVSARLSVVCEGMSYGRHIWLSWASTVVLFSSTLLCLLPPANWLPAIVLLSIAVLVSVIVFNRYWSPAPPPLEERPRQWFVESAVAPLAACVGWLSILLLS